ncbi:hypothetical protein [Bacillus mycoides]
MRVGFLLVLATDKGRYVNYTCMEYTIQKTPHITFSKWYNKEKRWRFHHEKTGQSFMDEYFMFHASQPWLLDKLRMDNM